MNDRPLPPEGILDAARELEEPATASSDDDPSTIPVATSGDRHALFSREISDRSVSKRRPKTRRRIFQALDLHPVERWLEPDLPASAIHVDSLTKRTCEEAHLDTDDWRVHRAGLSLVIRRFGPDEAWAVLESRDAERPFFRCESRLKARSFSGGVSELLAVQGALGSHCRSLVGRRELTPLFSAQVRVQQYRLREAPAVVADEASPPAVAAISPASPDPKRTARDGWRATLTLEETRIPIEGRAHPIVLSQVEVDEQGSKRPDFWNEFIEVCGLRLEARSRLDRLLVAAGLTAPPPAELGPTEIRAESTVAEVAFAVLRQFMLRVLEHEPGTRLGEDIEELHQMRVGSRKLRSAVKLYRQYLPPRILALENELRWVGSVLGPVRDLDVQQIVLRELAEEIPARDRVPLEALWQSLASDHGRERKKMLRALDSRRFERFKERWIGALRQGPPRTFREGRRPALAVVPELITAMHEKVNRRRRKLSRKSPPSAYHRLRVRLKALRYAVEFHRDLYPKWSKPYSKRVVWWQDCLGDHQDADVGEEVLRGFVTERGRRFPPETNFSIGMLAECYRERARDLRDRVWHEAPALSGAAWKRLSRAMKKRAATVPVATASSRPRPKPGPSPESAPDQSAPDESAPDEPAS